jgi:hypothetical protein
VNTETPDVQARQYSNRVLFVCVEHAAPGSECTRRLNAAAERSYHELRTRHIADYEEMFHRSELVLTESAAQEDGLPLDRRIDKVQDGGLDLGLYELMYSYNRYLIISSSRQGSQPMNLQVPCSTTDDADFSVAS